MHAVTVGVGTSSAGAAGGGHHHYPNQSDRVGWPSVGVSKVECSECSHGDETFVGNLLLPVGQEDKSAFQLNMEKSGLGRKSLEEEKVQGCPVVTGVSSLGDGEGGPEGVSVSTGMVDDKPSLSALGGEEKGAALSGKGGMKKEEKQDALTEAEQEERMREEVLQYLGGVDTNLSTLMGQSQRGAAFGVGSGNYADKESDLLLSLSVPGGLGGVGLDDQAKQKIDRKLLQDERGRQLSQQVQGSTNKTNNNKEALSQDILLLQQQLAGLGKLSEGSSFMGSIAGQQSIGAHQQQRSNIEMMPAGLDAKQTAVVDCPKNMVGRVIGKGGETIKALQQYTGAMIQIDQSTDPTRVTIAGSPQSLQLAVAMVSDIVRGTFKGFAMLRQIAMATAVQSTLGPMGPPQPMYVQGYGFLPPSQAVGGSQMPGDFQHAGNMPREDVFGGPLRTRSPPGPLTPPVTPLRSPGIGQSQGMQQDALASMITQQQLQQQNGAHSQDAVLAQLLQLAILQQQGSGSGLPSQQQALLQQLALQGPQRSAGLQGGLDLGMGSRIGHEQSAQGTRSMDFASHLGMGAGGQASMFMTSGAENLSPSSSRRIAATDENQQATMSFLTGLGGGSTQLPFGSGEDLGSHYFGSGTQQHKDSKDSLNSKF
jgi:predicted RNA-binding protein YlqC (UPF0109 family)